MFSSLARGISRKRPSISASQPLLSHDDTDGNDNDTEAGGRATLFGRRPNGGNSDYRVSEGEDMHEDQDEAEVEADEQDPLLPIFSAAHLGSSIAVRPQVSVTDVCS